METRNKQQRETARGIVFGVIFEALGYLGCVLWYDGLLTTDHLFRWEMVYVHEHLMILFMRD